MGENNDTIQELIHYISPVQDTPAAVSFDRILNDPSITITVPNNELAAADDIRQTSTLAEAENAFLESVWNAVHRNFYDSLTERSIIQNVADTTISDLTSAADVAERELRQAIADTPVVADQEEVISVLQSITANNILAEENAEITAAANTYPSANYYRQNLHNIHIDRIVDARIYSADDDRTVANIDTGNDVWGIDRQRLYSSNVLAEWGPSELPRRRERHTAQHLISVEDIERYTDRTPNTVVFDSHNNVIYYVNNQRHFVRLDGNVTLTQRLGEPLQIECDTSYVLHPSEQNYTFSAHGISSEAQRRLFQNLHCIHSRRITPAPETCDECGAPVNGRVCAYCKKIF